MNSIIDELRYSPQDRPLSEAAVAHVTQMNLLYRNRFITQNELRVGLGGKSIGAAGDRYAPENRQPDRPQPILDPSA